MFNFMLEVAATVALVVGVMFLGCLAYALVESICTVIRRRKGGRRG